MHATFDEPGRRERPLTQPKHRPSGHVGPRIVGILSR